MRDAPPACPGRRCLLLSVASMAALPLVPACSPAPDRTDVTVVPGDHDALPEWPPAEVPLSSLPRDRRVTVQWGQVAVELRRTEAGVEARALLCTHQGCRLAWEASTASYRCPCHDGRFDAAGVPISGAPTRPMFRVPLLVSPTTIYVGARPRA